MNRQESLYSIYWRANWYQDNDEAEHKSLRTHRFRAYKEYHDVYCCKRCGMVVVYDYDSQIIGRWYQNIDNYSGVGIQDCDCVITDSILTS